MYLGRTGMDNKNRTYNRKALNELKDILTKNFPGYVDKVILFGSRATGDAQKFSDYDILVLLNKPFDWKLKNEIYDKTWEVDFKFDIFTDIKLVSKNELNTIKGKQPFIMDAFENGVVI